MHVDFWQLAAFFCYQYATILWLAKAALFEASLHLSKHLRKHQRPNVTEGQSSTGSHCNSSSITRFPFSLFCRFCFPASFMKEKNSKQEKQRDKEEAASLPAFVSIMCHGCTWLSCSVWLSRLLQQSLFPCWKSVSLRGRRRPLICIHFSSAQCRCSHLADISSSADTSPLHGPSWLTGSCPYG